ncbi:MAG: hypothetical protein BWY42_00834 [Candidatus Omnitrophica bacterium ADurb.Bin277]|nr:MAG: hypothetical protein BWY42_00834 [Candidatus Omnitrophica bacterium ADurb.Bin277]
MIVGVSTLQIGSPVAFGVRDPGKSRTDRIADLSGVLGRLGHRGNSKVDHAICNIQHTDNVIGGEFFGRFEQAKNFFT